MLVNWQQQRALHRLYAMRLGLSRSGKRHRRTTQHVGGTAQTTMQRQEAERIVCVKL